MRCIGCRKRLQPRRGGNPLHESRRPARATGECRGDGGGHQAIGAGMLLLVGIEADDGEADIRWLSSN